MKKTAVILSTLFILILAPTVTRAEIFSLGSIGMDIKTYSWNHYPDLWIMNPGSYHYENDWEVYSLSDLFVRPGLTLQDLDNSYVGKHIGEALSLSKTAGIGSSLHLISLTKSNEPVFSWEVLRESFSLETYRTGISKYENLGIPDGIEFYLTIDLFANFNTDSGTITAPTPFATLGAHLIGDEFFFTYNPTFDLDYYNLRNTEQFFEYEGKTYSYNLDIFSLQELGNNARADYLRELSSIDRNILIFDFLDEIIGGVGNSDAFAFSGVREVPNPAPTPEPGTIILMGAGLLGMLGMRKRFKK